jgi:hypothetical protein
MYASFASMYLGLAPREISIMATIDISIWPFPDLPPVNAVPDFVAGLIYGLTGDNHLTELEKCFDG